MRALGHTTGGSWGLPRASDWRLPPLAASPHPPFHGGDAASSCRQPGSSQGSLQTPAPPVDGMCGERLDPAGSSRPGRERHTTGALRPLCGGDSRPADGPLERASRGLLGGPTTMF